MKYIGLIVLVFGVTFQMNGQQVSVEVNGVKSSQGVFRVAVFDSSKSYDDDDAILKLSFAKENLKNGKATFDVKLPKDGYYAIKILDDTNKNAKMDYSLFGVPQEGYGFSNYYHSGILLPGYDEVKFNTLACAGKLKVKLRYW